MISSHACSATPAPLQRFVNFPAHPFSKACRFLFWRRGWDSNPRYREGTPVFETGLFGHSSTSPTYFTFFAKFEKTPARPDRILLPKPLGARLSGDSGVRLRRYFSKNHTRRFWDHARQRPIGAIGRAPSRLHTLHRVRVSRKACNPPATEHPIFLLPDGERAFRHAPWDHLVERCDCDRVLSPRHGTLQPRRRALRVLALLPELLQGRVSCPSGQRPARKLQTCEKQFPITSPKNIRISP